MAAQRNTKPSKSVKPKKSASTPSKNARNVLQKQQKKLKKQAEQRASSHLSSGAAATEGSDTDGDAEGEEDVELNDEGIETIEERVAVESPSPLLIPGNGKLATNFFECSPELVFEVFELAAGQAVLDRNLADRDTAAANRIELDEYFRFALILRSTLRLAVSCMAKRIVLHGDFTETQREREAVFLDWAANWRVDRTPELHCEWRGELPQGGDLLAKLKALRKVKKFFLSLHRVRSKDTPFQVKSLIDFPFDHDAEVVIVPARFLLMKDLQSVIDLPKPFKHCTLGSHHPDQSLPHTIQSFMGLNLESFGLNYNDDTHADFLTFAANLHNAPNLRQVEFVRAIGLATFPALSASNVEVLTTREVWSPYEMSQLTGEPDSGSFPNLKVLRLPVYAAPSRDGFRTYCGEEDEHEEAKEILGSLQSCLEERGRSRTPALRSLERIEFVGAEAGDVDLDVIAPGLKAVCTTLGIHLGPRE